MKTLREMIEDGEVHVVDGAMGTLLYDRGIFVNVCYDELAVSNPELVEGIHREYVEAGAEILETNTFGANPVKLSGFGLEGRTEEFNRTAAVLAKKAAGARARVVGAIGPLGIRIEPWGPTSEAEARGYFRRQATGLVEGGVDGFFLETFSDPNELHQALLAVRSVSDLPVFAQVTIEEGGATSYGTAPEAVAGLLDEWEADVIGVNCSIGPAEILDAVERMASVTRRPLVAQPNAGLPRLVGDRTMYVASPAHMARYALRMVEAGVRFVGGCCGTTPQHIREIRAAVDGRGTPARRGEVVRPGGGAGRPRASAEVAPPVSSGRRSRFLEALRGARPVRAVELRPPPAGKSGGGSGEGSVEASIDLDRSVRALLKDGRFVLFTDDAVGNREEESLQHLTANLGADADLSGVVPFLTLRHTLEYCLLFAKRAASHGLGGVTVTGGDEESGRPRCLPRSRDLRRRIREQVPGLPLGAWVNPHRDPVGQVDLLLEEGHEADYYVTQVVSHYDLAALDLFLEEGRRRGLALPGLVGVFYYRSGNRDTLRRLEGFIPVPTRPLLADLEGGVPPDVVCARTLRELEARGVEQVYVSNLSVRGTSARLKAIEALVTTDGA